MLFSFFFGAVDAGALDQSGVFTNLYGSPWSTREHFGRSAVDFFPPASRRVVETIPSRETATAPVAAPGSGFGGREMARVACPIHRRGVPLLLHTHQRARRGRLASAPNGRGLTRREWEVAQLLRDRFSAEEIADRLKISRRTVEKHIEHIYLKMDVHSRKVLREGTAAAPESGAQPGATA
jgi:DNA-binding CsgD family transcriptional regulator